MGFSWSLYFCQALIEARVIASGVESCHFIRDRHTLPTLLPGHIFCAVYVDNVCMISTEAGLARKAAEAAFQCLESVGLKCHDVEQSEEETIFTGLSFDHKRRRISIKRDRAWTLYEALDFARKQPRMTGQQMEKLLGHFTWAALIRREALCIPAVCYQFMRAAYHSCLAPWTAVRQELKWMRDIIPLLFCDLGRGRNGAVLATDAQGDSQTRLGGYGITEREMGSTVASQIGIVSEKWRYDVQGAIKARHMGLSGRTLRPGRPWD